MAIQKKSRTRTRTRTKSMGDDPLAWIKKGSEKNKKKDHETNKTEIASSAQDIDAGATSPGIVAEKNNPDQKATAQAGSNVDKSDTETGGELSPLVLDQSLTISDVGTLYGNLQGYIDAEGDLYIDASRVQMLDMAGMQLLVVFVQDLKKNQRSVHWQNPSPAFRKAAELMDLETPLQLPDA